MRKQIANYTVVISPDTRTGTNAKAYSAFVPILGIATDADTLEEIQTEVRNLIEFHLQSLAEEDEEIPVESSNSLVTFLEAKLPEKVLSPDK